MRKLLLLMALIFIGATNTYAQFEKGKWYINASYTGIEISDIDHIDCKSGLNVSAGNFIDNDFLLLINYKISHNEESVGANIRYYLSSCGVYGGMGIAYNKHSEEGRKYNHTASFTPEVGYSFFINGIVTIEPALYYDWNLKTSDYSKLGLKLGVGVYF